MTDNEASTSGPMSLDWILAVIALGLLTCVVCSGAGVGMFAWNRSKATGLEEKKVAQAGDVDKKPKQQEKAEKPKTGSVLKTQPEPPATKPEPEPVKLTMIYHHSAKLSQGKLIKASDPIPAGWTGGDGFRSVTIQQAQWEQQLNAILASGKEGDAAEIRR